MLAPEYLDHLADALLELYSQLDTSIIQDIARRLAKTGTVTNTAQWQIDRLREAGLLYDDVVAEVAKYANATDRQIKALFEEAGIVSTDLEMKLYERAGLHAPPIRMSPAALELLKAGIQKTGGEIRNLTMTTAITTQQAYINACTIAEMQVESGMLDYQTAIRRAIQEASWAGSTVSYPSGHVDRLDVAIRRACLTGVNQTMGKVSLQYADEFGCDIMELTAHGGARPSHAVWQGQLVSRSGKRGYLSLDDIGYGTGPGFMGWNCRHSWNPFFEGISSRNWTPEKLKALNERRVEYNGKQYTDYEASQIQRRIEREIRQTKRQLAAYDEARKMAQNEQLINGLTDDFAKGSVKLKDQERRLKDMLEQTRRLPDNSRIQVQGFGRSQAQKAVWVEKKTVEKYSTYHYNRDRTICITDDWKGKKHPHLDSTYKPYAVVETVSTNGTATQIDRTVYDEFGKMKLQVHSGPHGAPQKHSYGKRGEHAHDYIWKTGKEKPDRTTRDLNDLEKKEHGDILP